MAHHAALEESERPDALGAVDDLIRHHEIPGLDRLLQAAYGRESDDGADADRAERGDVCAGGDLVRCEFVVQAMAGEERDGDGLSRRRRGVVEDGDWR